MGVGKVYYATELSLRVAVQCIIRLEIPRRSRIDLFRQGSSTLEITYLLSRDTTHDFSS